MLPVNEVFATIQGEGRWAGTPAVFVRLQGCEVGCPWCDTKHTWELDGSQPFTQMTTTELVGQIQTAAGAIRHVVITGGEPLMHPIDGLINALHGFTVQIETSGTYPPPGADCWLTVSPKFDMPGGRAINVDCIRRADEIKQVVGKVADIQQLEQLLPVSALISLQPVSQSRKATALCVEACKARGWNLSLQLHKYADIP